MNEPMLRKHLRQLRLRRELPEPAMCRYLRKRAGFTQQQVADVLDVTRVTVARWETGARSPSDEHLADYLELLGIGMEAASA